MYILNNAQVYNPTFVSSYQIPRSHQPPATSLLIVDTVNSLLDYCHSLLTGLFYRCLLWLPISLKVNATVLTVAYKDLEDFCPPAPT